MKGFRKGIAIIFLAVQTAFGQQEKTEYYSLTIYRIANSSQQERVDNFLRSAYLPALHRLGKNKVGVFKPIAKDTAAFGKIIYVLVPFSSLDEFQRITSALDVDSKLKLDGAEYVNAAHNNAPYSRMETILMKAFAKMPKMETPQLMGARSERIYELRSYEGATEKLYKSKVKMFNDGDEIGLFKRLNFNSIFYAEVLSGSRMPNLMYMTSFDNMASRDEHWKAFFDDPQWKKLLAIEEYKNTVSKADISLLSSTDYSDY